MEISSANVVWTQAMVACAAVYVGQQSMQGQGVAPGGPGAKMPWGFGTGLDSPSDADHLVWSRDEYEMVTALIADGDLAGAGRALDFPFNVQQKSDGSFPQNSKVDGTPVWGGLQLDEVGDPIILTIGSVLWRD